MSRTVAFERIIPTVREANKLAGDFMTRSHVKYDIPAGMICVDRRTGKFLAYQPIDTMDARVFQPAHEIMATITKTPNNRGTVVAGKGSMMPGVTVAGELGGRIGVDKAIMSTAGNPKSDILGFFDYEDDRCGGTELSLSNPKWLGPEVMSLFRAVNSLYQCSLPKLYAKQKKVVSQISRSYVMDGTLNTTATLNSLLRTAAHRDSGDHPDATSALVVTAGGTGGGLVIPEYGLHFALKPGDVLFMDAHLLHGNLPFSGERQTTVLYVREKLHLCPNQ
jgi:hypothetical protein